LPNYALCAPPRRKVSRSLSSDRASALGSGYTVFFIYSALVGVFAVVLAFVVAARRGKAETTVKTAAEARS